MFTGLFIGSVIAIAVILLKARSFGGKQDAAHTEPKREIEVVNSIYWFSECYNFKEHQKYNLVITPPKGFSGEIMLPETHNGLPVPFVQLKNDETMNIPPIYIPKWVDSFNAQSPIRVEVDPENIRLKSDGRALYCWEFLKMYFPSAEESYIVPDGVTEIDARAFEGAKSLREVVLPESVKEIYYIAFSKSGIEKINLENIRKLDMRVFLSCKNLDNIRLTCEEIPQSAFYDCSSLRSVTLENTKIIGHYAFDGTAIERLRLPPTIDKIDGLLDINIIEITMSENSTIFSGGGDEFKLKVGTQVVILSENGEVLCEVKAYDRHVLRYCDYNKPLGFDFAKFDEDIRTGGDFDIHKYRAALFRIDHPYDPPADGLTELAKRFAARYVELLIMNGNAGELAEFKFFDCLTGEEFMRFIKEMSSADRPEITALLLQKQRELGKYGANMGDDEDF